MTNEKIKETLLAVRDAPIDFTVTQSGKKSRKVHGLYKSAECEIIIHNRNFEKNDADGGLVIDENLLLYTAIHEYAHHIHACQRGGKLPARAHTTEFWAIFHSLLDDAEEKGAYKNSFVDCPELQELTETIRKKYLGAQGELLLEFGNALLKAYEICDREGFRFEDYVDRVLRIPRTAMKTAMKLPGMKLAPQLGPDNLRFLSSIGDDDRRGNAEKALLGGKSTESVKAALRKETAPAPEDPKERLKKEKLRLERTINSLKDRLMRIDEELEELA